MKSSVTLILLQIPYRFTKRQMKKDFSLNLLRPSLSSRKMKKISFDLKTHYRNEQSFFSITFIIPLNSLVRLQFHYECAKKLQHLLINSKDKEFQFSKALTFKVEGSCSLLSFLNPTAKVRKIH